MHNNLLNTIVRRDLVTADENRLKLFKSINFSMYPARAMAVALNRLAVTKSPDYLIKLGKIMGMAAALEIKENLLKIGPFISKDYKQFYSIIELAGFGSVSNFINSPTQILISFVDHPVIIPAKKLYGEKSDICKFYEGVYTSFIEVFFKMTNLKLIHTKCVCNGDNICEWCIEK